MVVTVGVPRATGVPAAARRDRRADRRAPGGITDRLVCAAAALLLGLVPAIRLTSTRSQALAWRDRGTAPSRLVDTFVALAGRAVGAAARRHRPVRASASGRPPRRLRPGKPASVLRRQRRLRRRRPARGGACGPPPHPGPPRQPARRDRRPPWSQSSPMNGGICHLLRWSGVCPSATARLRADGECRRSRRTSMLMGIQRRGGTRVQSEPTIEPAPRRSSSSTKPVARGTGRAASPIGRCIRIRGHRSMHRGRRRSRQAPPMRASRRHAGPAMAGLMLLPIERFAACRRAARCSYARAGDPRAILLAPATRRRKRPAAICPTSTCPCSMTSSSGR